MQNVEDAIAQFLQHCRVKNLTPATLRNYTRWLRAWQTWRSERGLSDALANVTRADFTDYLAYLQGERVAYCDNPHRPNAQTGLSANSVAGAHRTLRALWRWLANEECLSGEQARYFNNGRIPAPRLEEEPRPVYNEESFQRLLDAARSEDPEEHYRDHLILHMLAETGMRVSELCNLTDEQIDQAKCRARIRGKGGKWRFVFWSDDTTYHLARYLEFRRGEPGGPLLRGIGSKNDGNALNGDSIRKLLRRLSQKSGVELPRGAPVHAIRHTFAHRGLHAGLDISQVAQLLGHSDVATTMRYLRANPDELQEIYERMRRS
jgi:site-specific recombinase XerD